VENGERRKGGGGRKAEQEQDHGEKQARQHRQNTRPRTPGTAAPSRGRAHQGVAKPSDAPRHLGVGVDGASASLEALPTLPSRLLSCSQL